MRKPILTGLSFLLFALSNHQAAASNFTLPIHRVCPLVSPGCVPLVPIWWAISASTGGALD